MTQEADAQGQQFLQSFIRYLSFRLHEQEPWQQIPDGADMASFETHFEALLSALGGTPENAWYRHLVATMKAMKDGRGVQHVPPK